MMLQWELVSPDTDRLEVPGGWLYRVIDETTDAVIFTGFVADPPVGDAIARGLRDLGNGNAMSEMGAIEGLAVKVGKVADAIDRIADQRERG